MDLNKFIIDCEVTLRESGKYLLHKFKEGNNGGQFNIKEIKIEADRESEKIILDSLKQKYNDLNIVSEEVGITDNKSEYTLLVDPLDGSDNFARGIPYFSNIVTLVKYEEVLAACLYVPVLDDFYYAIAGQGFFKNGQRVHTKSSNLPLVKSAISYIRGHATFANESIREEGNKICKVLEANAQRVIQLWAPGLDWALVAEGKISTLVCFENEIQETFCGLLMCKEAGLRIYSLEGDDYKFPDKSMIVASNEFLKNELVELIINMKV